MFHLTKLTLFTIGRAGGVIFKALRSVLRTMKHIQFKTNIHNLFRLASLLSLIAFCCCCCFSAIEIRKFWNSKSGGWRRRLALNSIWEMNLWLNWNANSRVSGKFIIWQFHWKILFPEVRPPMGLVASSAVLWPDPAVALGPFGRSSSGNIYHIHLEQIRLFEMSH